MTLKSLMSGLASLALIASVSSVAYAKQAPCRDTHGKFIKCADKPKPQRCRNAKGQFAKCGTPGVMPAK
jgi:hypothetical protein